jgi:tetratricopeptide (TPR) repeat protein
LLIGLLSALVATNQPVALSNLVVQKTGFAVTIPDRNDPVEKEYHKLLAQDDDAQAEVDRWITDDQKFAEKGAGIGAATLQARIRHRFEPVKKAYEDFLQHHPDHVRARLAYGGFLSDIHEEDDAAAQWEKARELDPKNPVPYNNLANHYGHEGPVAKAFEYYSKAVELAPNESLYYFNFATTVYLFRQDATNYFKISEQQVFEKAMALYRKALDLDPDNFVLATDLAQSYYGFKPRKTGDEETDRRLAQKHTDEALAAWEVALKLARDDIERQGVYIHFARLNINAGRFAEANRNLNAVTNEMFTTTKKNLIRKLENDQQKAKGAGTPAASNNP